MKKTSILTLALAFALVAVVVPAYSQVAPAPQTPQQAPQQAPPAASAAKTFEGELSKVDTTLKTITAKGADSKEMSFVYNDTTMVVGGDKTVQGLAGKTGAHLRISYREERGSNQATRIEIVEKGQQPQQRPQTPGQPPQQPR